MNDPYSPQSGQFPYESAVERDLRLQADPELAAGEGRASPSMIMIYFAAMVFAVCVVFYGLSHQSEEIVATNSAPAGKTTQTAQVAPAENTTPKRDVRDASNQQKNGPQGEPKQPQQGQSGGGQPGETPGPK
ncbi:MAG TPA: hypothetical protein VNR41_11840 [Xanthobacteraceae bacterium]|jgi:hypothetical protein|nr:hypothetical protein [Xanthobacteraceae bacterium]